MIPAIRCRRNDLSRVNFETPLKSKSLVCKELTLRRQNSFLQMFLGCRFAFSFYVYFIFLNAGKTVCCKIIRQIVNQPNIFCVLTKPVLGVHLYIHSLHECVHSLHEWSHECVNANKTAQKMRYLAKLKNQKCIMSLLRLPSFSSCFRRIMVHISSMALNVWLWTTVDKKTYHFYIKSVSSTKHFHSNE